MKITAPSKRKNQTLGVAITTGDPDGVGFEVACKALIDLGPQKNVNFFLFRDSNQEKKQVRYFKLLDKKFARLTFPNVVDAVNFWNVLKRFNSNDSGFIFDIASKDDAATWVIMALHLCQKNILNSMVTGPLSKTLIQSSGYNFVGHTGIFRHYYPKRKFFMAFRGSKFNVVLLSDHIALKDVENFVDNPSLLTDFFNASLKFHNSLRGRKKAVLLGLNPHAGEKGIIGGFEQRLMKSKWFQKGFARKLVGPLSADGAFLKEHWARYSTYLALYHDQGLIPFKMIHGQDSGVHITLGLPFVRTSVDHGTAKALFNKDRAAHLSMRDAIEYNIQLTKGKKI